MVSADAPIPENLGIIIEITYENLIQATVPIKNLEAIAVDENVLSVMIPPRAQPNNHVTSEGMRVIGSDTLNAHGHTGKGVKVAVIDGGFDINNPEIKRNIVDYRSFGDPLGIVGDDDQHGTAVAEVIVDIAPDVKLHLYNSSYVGFFNLIDYIIDRGDIDIISMSLGYYNVGYADGTSRMAQKVNEARDNGILFIKSAGNSADRHWQGQFSDTDVDGWHNFQSRDETINVNLLEGKEIKIYLSWDDWPISNQDYELVLAVSTPSGLREIAVSENTQDGNYEPTERIIFTPSYNMEGNILIQNYSSTKPVNFQLFVLGYTPEEYIVPESSITIPGDASGSFTVGASNWEDDVLEYYSSRGPTLDGRIKPDIISPTNVTTTADSSFGGTSAAAPHVAGAAALVMEKYPNATADDVQTILESITQYHREKSNTFGTGRLSLHMLPGTDILALDNSNRNCDPCFFPETLRINSGDNVTWINADIEPIQIIRDYGTKSYVSDYISRGGILERVYTGNGIVEYYDALHPWATGKIIVTLPPPTLLYAGITGPNQITAHFSEIVYATTSDFTDLQLIPGGSRIISSVNGSGTDTLTLTFSGQVASVNATATMDVGSGITNAANTPFESADNYPIASGQSPRITQATFTGPSTISIKFSKPVIADTGDFSDFKVTSTAAGLDNDVRNISVVTGSGTDTIHVIAQGPFNLDTVGTIDIASNIVDLFGNTLAGNLDNYPVDRDQSLGLYMPN